MNSFDSPVATVTNYMSIQERIRNIGKKPESLKQQNDFSDVSSHSSGEITVNNLIQGSAEEMTREQTAMGSNVARENSIIAEWQTGESQVGGKEDEGEDERSLFDQMLLVNAGGDIGDQAQPETANKCTQESKLH